jgi:adenylate cyclase
VSADDALDARTLASRAGVAVERVEELTGYGLLSPEDGRYSLDDIGRVGVIEAVLGEGIAVEELAQAASAGVVSLAWFEGVLPPVPTLLDRTYGEISEDVGIPFEVVTRLFEQFGIVTPSPDDRGREDDARILAHVGRARAALGDSDAAILGGTRYFGDNIRRIAESQIGTFQREIIEPMFASGASLREVIERLNPLIADVIRPAVADLLVWLHRRHVDALNLQMLVQTLEGALARAGVEVLVSPRPPAIAFLDLTGFTRLTDEAGDQEAVALAAVLSDLVRSGALHHGGTAVKLLGDGVMFHFPNADDAVRCALHLVPEAAGRDLPPARVGVHAGPVVFRDGDYFGRTVNVAARITDYARPREVLVSDAVVTSVGESQDVAFDPIGPVALKGVSEPVVLHAARAIGSVP